MDYRTTAHAEKVIAERDISRRWIEETLSSPERTEDQEDGTVHFLRRIVDRDGRALRVITTAGSRPILIVTAFFDRRIKDLSQ